MDLCGTREREQRNHSLKYESDCVRIGIGIKIFINRGSFVRDRFVKFLSSTPQSNRNILSVLEQVFIPAVSIQVGNRTYQVPIISFVPFPGGQRKIAIVHFFCSCTICFAVVPCFCSCAFCLADVLKLCNIPTYNFADVQMK